MPARKTIVVPPGGFAGFAQQTAATQALLRGSAPKRRRKTAKKAPRRKKATVRKRPARRASTARKKKPARLVKGSAAAKRHMAKLRRMRKTK